MYSTVIFDLDGTLLDTLDDLTDATNAALIRYGLSTHSRERVCSFVGDGMKVLIERATGGRATDEVLATFKAYYAAHCKDKTKPYCGIMELLQSLRARGIKTAVLSNKADAAVKTLAEEYFQGMLDEAAGEDEAHGIRKKPAPDALFAVMKRLGAERENTLYVGDSDVDIATARNAGVDCVCVTWGFRDEAFLRAHGATTLVREPREILDIV